MLAPSLTALFNKSIALGKVPADWKYANIVPFPKNDKTHIVSNYRPISLSLVSKAFALVVHNRVLYIVKPILHDQQRGFLLGKSCITFVHTCVMAVKFGHPNQHLGPSLSRKCPKTSDQVYPSRLHLILHQPFKAT